MKIRHIVTLAIAALLTSAASACWYSKSNYTDYIFSVNGIKMIAIDNLDIDNVAKYTITNNVVVDFPLTVSMKLISDEVITLNQNSTTNIPEIMRGKLQYRVLPDGNWVTVSEYNTPTGTILKDAQPATYFGKNNISPIGCKEGDILMVRLYVTDGIWQSGELADLCTNKLEFLSTANGQKFTLPFKFQYKMDGKQMLQHNLGGKWYPHLCMTVQYSGHKRQTK